MSDDRAAQRRQLRTELRERRRLLTAATRIAAAEAIADRLLALPFASHAGHVAGYWAMDGEIALHAWQLRLPSDQVYCLPVLSDDRLRFAPWRPGDALLANRHGIPEPDVNPASLLEPEDMALVVVPLVGFHANGHRLGMGGGWYDRTFAFRRHSPSPPWLVGTGFALQQLGSLEPAEWDVPLDAVCTETATHFRTPPAR